MLLRWLRYQKLAAEDEPKEDTSQMHETPYHSEDDSATSSSRRIFTRIAWMLLRVLVITLALWGAVDLTRRIHDSSVSRQQDSRCYCGESVAEAISKGCTYDLLASAWLPDYCRDKELSAEFDQAGPGPEGAWDYFEDPNGTLPLRISDVGLFADTPGKLYYTTNEWHIVHCVYYWRKQYRSRSTGIIVEARYDNEGHISHCGKMFLRYMKTPPFVDTSQGASLESP